MISSAVIHDWPRAYNDYSQDARTWLSRGTLDATLPMLYRYKPEDFEFVLRDHLESSHDRWVLPGLSTGRSSREELLELIEISRRLGAPGVAIFSYSGLFPKHRPGDKAAALLEGPFAQRVSVPERSW